MIRNIKMRVSLVFLVFVFAFSSSLAQDTITKRNSEKIVAKILEITPTEIKFKKFDFQDGPTYLEKKSDIEMIVYSNGDKDVFEAQKQTQAPEKSSDANDYYPSPVQSNHIDLWTYKRYEQNGRYLTESEMHEIMLNTKDKKLMMLVEDAKDGKLGQLIGFVGIPLGIGAYGLLYGAFLNGTGYRQIKPNTTFLTASGICAVAAISCPIAAGNFRKRRIAADKALVKMYNEKY